ncbi:MAG TPA: ABC transporter ATP-binding protein [Bacteroidia bacterium]|nr:ABC transporter ATP-binding protein [Bacteroidia bacterium]
MRSLSHLNKYFLKYKWHLLGGIFFVALSNMFAIIPARLIRFGLDFVQENIQLYGALKNFSLENNFYEHLTLTILLVSLLVLVCALIKGVFMFLMRQTIIVMSRHIEYDLKNEVFRHYLKLDLGFYRQNSTGDLINRIAEDVSRVRMYVGPAIMYSINMLVMFILVSWAMFSVNAKLALFVMLPLPLMSFMVYYIQNVINKQSDIVQSHLSRISTFVQESFSGIRIIKAFVRERMFSSEIEKESDAYRTESMKLITVNAYFIPIMILLVGLSSLMTIYIGGLEVIKGNITIGNIAEFVIYVNMLTWPVAALGYVVSLVQRAAASQERINEFLLKQPLIESGTITLDKRPEQIEFDSVSFTYKETGLRALNEISFELNKGKTLAICGPTGSGKTSIANMIMRLFDPDQGEIRINYQVLSKLDLSQYRSNVAYVPQDVFLFSDTILNNINFGNLSKDKINEETAKHYSELAGVYDNIKEFPSGFQTILGERGITLSGGQKQRVSIARALLRNPSLLILDDCLSAVDTLTEETILNNLKEFMKDRMSVMISHRISTIMHADEIIVLDNGKIVEKGNHADLMKNGAYYAQTYHKQLAAEHYSNVSG